MTNQLSFTTLKLFSIALCLEVAIVPSFFTKAQALSESANRSQNITNSSVVQISFDPPGEGKPSDSVGGASRGDECSGEITATAGCVIPLIPATKNGLTAAEHPTFFVYVPETSAKEIFFSLVDEDNHKHYQTKIPVTVKSGILSFKLPDNAPALEVDKNYRWAFILIGEQGLRPDSPGVQGEIRRVQLNVSLKSKLDQVKAVERAALYGKNGLWYDTLTALAEARRSQPNDSNLAASWENLMKSVGLDAIATKPLL